MTVLPSTPFRSLTALPLSTWEAEFSTRQSPLTTAEIGECFAACQGWAILLDQGIGETSLRDADAIRDKNLLRMTEADGSTFRKFSAFWKPFAAKYQQLFDPAYKQGAYYPKDAADLTLPDGGRIDGYNLSLAGYKVIYQGGPRCLSSRGRECANGETYDPNRPMEGASVISDPTAPSINRSIAAAMERYGRWFGFTPAPDPERVGRPYDVAGITARIILPFPLKQAIVPTWQTNQRPGQRMTPDRYVQHDTGNRSRGANALMHKNYLLNGAEGQQLSYHFTVDDKEAWQMIPVNEVAWHGGDGGGPCNYRGISCELCINADINVAKSRENAAILAAEIMNTLGISRLDKHQNCAGKWCPQDLLNAGKWPWFVERVNILRGERG